jgi:hypothetical protein
MAIGVYEKNCFLMKDKKNHRPNSRNSNIYIQILKCLALEKVKKIIKKTIEKDYNECGIIKFGDEVSEEC